MRPLEVEGIPAPLVFEPIQTFVAAIARAHDEGQRIVSLRGIYTWMMDDEGNRPW